MAGYVAVRRVEFAQTDMAGVMHFSEFFRVMETVEHEFLRDLGMSVYMKDGDRTLSWPRVSCGFDFYAPLRFEDEFVVDLGVEKLGDKSITYRCEFRKDDALCACGRMTVACCELKDGRMGGVRIPADVAEKLVVHRAPAAGT